MAVEFYCSRCNSLLRTSDDTIGMAARCPSCGSIERVPDPGLADIKSSTPSFEADAPVETPDSDKPIDVAYPGSERDRSNPYASPAVQRPANFPLQQPDRAAAQSRLMAPAICILVLSSIGVLGCLLGTLGGIIEVAQQGAEWEDVLTFIVFGGLLIVQLVSIIGATYMLRMKAYWMGVTAAFTSIFSGLACCFVPSIFGVWLVVLLDEGVKRQFS